MTNFKDIIFEENVAIHCPEEWMADNLLEYADSKGYQWNIGESYNNTRWYVNRGAMCYLLGNGTHFDIDRVPNNKDLYTVMKYEDVVIKDETSLNYELVIKGRKAKIGSELWHKDSNGEYEKVTIYSIILYDGKNVLIIVQNDKKTETKRHWLYDDMFTKGIDDILFWEKPTLYQLPDTDGNLSEVKVGQEVWVSNKTINRIWEAKIIGLDKNLGIFLRYINHEYKGHITTPNITGKESFLKVTTNKPHRDFSDCMDWSHAPKDAIEWRVTVDGYAFWYSNAYCERRGLDYDYDCGMYYIPAGYRADLLNENGAVEDWEYSLVKRPNNK